MCALITNRPTRQKVMTPAALASEDILFDIKGAARSFAAGECFALSTVPSERVFALRTGCVSAIVDLPKGRQTEIGMIGPGGLICANAAFGMSQPFSTFIATVRGVAWCMEVQDFAKIAARDRRLQDAVFKHQQWLLFQAQQRAGCSIAHTIGQRVAGWLLALQDTTGLPEIPVTQEVIAQRLGGTRTTVSAALAQLKREGLIRCQRGRIGIDDRSRLESSACECYATLKRSKSEIYG